MLKVKNILKWILYLFAACLLVVSSVFIYITQVSKINLPNVKDKSSLKLERKDEGNGFYTLKENWFRKSKSGLYELYVEGDGFERGIINGKLTRELVIRQEDHFSEQIYKMVPSEYKRSYLKYLIGWFNRKLDQNITEEYKEEIYGISESASDKYQYLGNNYQRILNYHAAHDIGHALQNLALVGCSSFGTWNNNSEDSTMIIGRNFDFYVGDKFAEDKIVAFFNPKYGHKFMTVTWGGFIGAVSGMNDMGLTVTINAAKSDYPLSSATPVSIVTREILQYAKNIAEAVAIAKSRNMFVSESFLVASAIDNKAVIIEKTPNTMDVYDSHKNYIICTNHFQSNELANSKKNIEQINESASNYRYERLKELINSSGKNNIQKTINILRDRRGLKNNNIGNGNEKAINQLIAHHSIVFEPQKQMVWVSTSPWQLGQFVAYDLKKIFKLRGLKKNVEVSDSTLTIPPDSFLLTKEYKDFESFRVFKQRILNGFKVNTDSLIVSNPEFYYSYILAGDYSYKLNDYTKALLYYNLALTKIIASKKEEDYIKDQIKRINNKLAL
ncbi:MAG: C45 family autoproteolytic acyltransferase/hydrolase [Bacteroidetes bacterium]|nr:C45 family autoproteolytic acyltransferase/hydrolase [Bacteroidota bacterium]